MDARTDDGQKVITIAHPEHSSGELINVKKIVFGNKEHTTDKKMGVSVLLRLVSSLFCTERYHDLTFPLLGYLLHVFSKISTYQ